MHHHLRPDRPGARLIGSLALGVLGLGLAAALGARTAQLAASVRTPGAVPGVDVLVELGVVAIGAVLAGWLGLSATVATGCLVARVAGHVWRGGERLVTRHGPAVVRRTLTVTVAAGIGLGSALGAQAEPSTTAGAAVVTADPGDLGWPLTEPAPNPSGGTAPAATPTGEPVDVPTTPSQPTTAATPGSPATPQVQAPAVDAPARPALPAPPPQSARGAAAQVVVQPGDTLWDIARRSLPEGASQAQIAAAWPAWYEANRQTVGADPDLIHPGQVLLAPVEGA